MLRGEPACDEITPTVLLPIDHSRRSQIGVVERVEELSLDFRNHALGEVGRFVSPMSQFCIPGSRRILRPELPKRGLPLAKSCARPEVVKQPELNHSFSFFVPDPLQVRSGRGDGDSVLE